MAEGGAVDFLRIPGNIKQQFAPFQVTKGGGLQRFSFKASSLKEAGTAGLINMVPSSISKNTEIFNQDLSFKNQKEFTNFNSILDILPTITIREYLPDTKLDQSLNFFQDIFTSIFKGKGKKEFEKAGESEDKATEASTGLKDRLTNVVSAVMKKIDSEGWLTLITGNVEEVQQAAAKMDKDALNVLKFPFFLYYKLQSCLTTNLYELPCVPSNNALYSSDGFPGWNGDTTGYMRLLPGFVKDVPIIGKMLDTLFGNMGINFTPWWDAEAGSKTPGPEVEFKFSLFNDDAESTLANFIFVNTVIAHCRWIQYGILQHSSALYDVSIAGIGKQYACMGQFNIQYKGALRKPSTYLMQMLQAHVGDRYVATQIANEKMIKIPDVYDVTMKFQSLLPQNFNTFVYNFIQNDMMAMSNPQQESGFKNLTDSIKDLSQTASDAWNK